MNTIEMVLLMLVLGAVTGIAARYIRGIPLPLIQIAMGALVAWPQDGFHVALDPDFFLLMFLPPLLFADGWRIPKRDAFALYKPILLLAFGLVFFTVFGLGFLIHWAIPSIPLTVAFALAAIVSPTDTVAVSVITGSLGVPPKTMNILNGESLLNDASGLVSLKFAVAAAMTGVFSWTEASQEFVWVAVGGAAIGAAIGWGFSKLRDLVTRKVGDMASTQMVLMLILLPFAAYIAGEAIQVSGILAAVAAGVATNFAEMNRSRFVVERVQTVAVFQLMESTFNGTIFLLLGLQLPTIWGNAMHGTSASHHWLLIGYVLAISVSLLAMRWIWIAVGVRGSLYAAHRDGKMLERPSPLITMASTLAGIRGAVTLAAALSLPLTLRDGSPFPARDLVIFLAAGVILFTLVVGSIGLPWVLRKLPSHHDDPVLQEEQRARLAACQAAIASLAEPDPRNAERSDEWKAQRQEVAGRLTADYRQRADYLSEFVTKKDPEAAATSAEAMEQRRQRYMMELELRLRCLEVERQTLYTECRAGRINDESLRHMVMELDYSEMTVQERLAVAKKGEHPAAAPAP